MTNWFLSTGLLAAILGFGAQLFRVAFLVLVFFIARELGNRFIKRAISLKIGSKTKTPQKETVEKMILNVFKYAINIIGALMIVSVFVPIATIVAGAGALTIVLTFAFQSMLADVVRGFFIIFEEMFLVGDTIETASYKGEVLEIGLRITKLRQESGETVLISNSNIINLVKYTQNGEKINLQ